MSSNSSEITANSVALPVSGSLGFITEKTPQWILQLDELSSKIASCKIELSELSDLTAHRLRAKNGSTESLRPGMTNEADPEHQAFEMEPSQMLANAAKQQHAQMLRRKRKTTSFSSESEPAFRTRSMIIIRYDSQVQDGFAQIVREIGTARNHMRKARMNESIAERVRQMPALGGDDSPFGGGALAGRLAFTRTSRSRAGGSAGGPSTQQNAYDLIDKSLENALSLCEQAAHQSLRDGDCAVEIQTIKDRMREASKLAEKEVGSALTKEAAAEVLNQQEAEDGSDTSNAKDPADESSQAPFPRGDDKIEVDDDA
ncbi:MAG: hypothetical protein M4579_002139 [Chaenotheca gracillima]|nr:MAG: hypothetical protein M4579_002139 [Chaenotheca gracillima]